MARLGQSLQSLRERLVVPEEAVTMAASLDGVLVPMKDGARAAKREQGRAEGKETRGPAGCYQEVGCALEMTPSLSERHDEPFVDPPRSRPVSSERWPART